MQVIPSFRELEGALRVDAVLFLRRFAVLAVPLAGLVACSPYTYRAEVAEFAAAAGETTAAFDAMVDEQVASAVAERRREFAAEHADLSVGDACGDAITDLVRAADADQAVIDGIVEAERRHCVIGVVDDATGVADPASLASISPEAVGPGVDLGGFPELLDAIDAYAASLGEIVRVADRESLERSLEHGEQSLSGLACELDLPGCASEPLGLAARVFRAGLLAGLDQQRYRALREVVGEADPLIQDASGVLSEGQVLLVVARLTERRDTMIDAQNALRFDSPDAESWVDNLAAFERARDDYLRTMEGLDAFELLADTHGELNAALQDPRRGLEDLRARLDEFKELAEQLNEARQLLNHPRASS